MDLKSRITPKSPKRALFSYKENIEHYPLVSFKCTHTNLSE